jgi:hypothetical protein
MATSCFSPLYHGDLGCVPPSEDLGIPGDKVMEHFRASLYAYQESAVEVRLERHLAETI